MIFCKMALRLVQDRDTEESLQGRSESKSGEDSSGSHVDKELWGAMADQEATADQEIWVAMAKLPWPLPARPRAYGLPPKNLLGKRRNCGGGGGALKGALVEQALER